MKPAPLKYIAARTLDQALAAKVRVRRGRAFSRGGQSLVPAMNFRLAQPDGADRHQPAGRARRQCLVSGRRTGTDRRADALSHARTRRERRPRSAAGGGSIAADRASADPQPRHAGRQPRPRRSGVRNAGSVLALGARLRARSGKGERWIAAEDFFAERCSPPRSRPTRC